jgi:hypothetical protein
MNTPTCSYDEEKLISAAYGDTGLFQRFQAWVHTRTCRTCAETWRGHRATAAAFRSIPPEKCPPRVIERVEAKIGLRPKGSRGATAAIMDFIFYRPAFAVSGSAAIVVVAAVLIFQAAGVFTPEPRAQYTDVEIERALDDIETTFAMIFPIVQNAQTNIYNKVMQSQVLPPVQNSLQRTNQLFTGQ